MTNRTEATQHYIDDLHEIEGITVLDVEYPRGVKMSAGFHDPCISWIDDRKHTSDEVEDWVVRTLKRERIQGEFFIHSFGVTVCHVRLENPWFWGRALWRLNNSALSVVSVERDYALSLFWTEHCNRRGRDRMGYGAFRWIKPPATAPIFWDKPL